MGGQPCSDTLGCPCRPCRVVENQGMWFCSCHAPLLSCAWMSVHMRTPAMRDGLPVSPYYLLYISAQRLSLCPGCAWCSTDTLTKREELSTTWGLLKCYYFLLQRGRQCRSLDLMPKWTCEDWGLASSQLSALGWMCTRVQGGMVPLLTMG